MYFNNLSGYGTKDFNKALKGTNIAAIQKGIDVQRAQLAKSKKPKDIARNQAQLAAAEARMAEVLAAQAPAPSVSPAPTVPAIVTPPPPVSAPQVTVAPLPAVAPPVPSVAPPPAAESVAMPLAQPATFFQPAPAAVPDSTAPAAPAESKMPLILGAGALGLLALMFLGKKKGR